MRPADLPLYEDLTIKLQKFQNEIPMPGIDGFAEMNCFILQIIDSVRRIKYVTTVRQKNYSPSLNDASTTLFDPIKAAVFQINQGNNNEALWLAFLSVHFGKNKHTGWALAKGLYGALGNPSYWTWDRASGSFHDLQKWLHKYEGDLRAVGSFGNHRKYQSLNAYSHTGTGAAIGSFIDWMIKHQGFQGLEAELQIDELQNPKTAFAYLYNDLDAVVSFGRTARFDFLTLIGKLGLVSIEPDSTYMNGATGPKGGARLLFAGDKNSPINEPNLNKQLTILDNHLHLYFGMQVLEDALCNWQKSPSDYTYFNG